MRSTMLAMMLGLALMPIASPGLFCARSRALTLSAPISATRALAEIAEDLVRGVVADHPDERTISLLGGLWLRL